MNIYGNVVKDNQTEIKTLKIKESKTKNLISLNKSEKKLKSKICNIATDMSSTCLTCNSKWVCVAASEARYRRNETTKLRFSKRKKTGQE